MHVSTHVYKLAGYTCDNNYHRKHPQTFVLQCPTCSCRKFLKKLPVAQTKVKMKTYSSISNVTILLFKIEISTCILADFQYKHCVA